jgi:lipopolysaccharide/colanic/teichoic acid biosynthesis glycosyltransferase
MELKPGVTGWAQINGRNSLTWEEKFALDVWYIDHRSFLLDMKIVAMTFFKVFARSGINAGEGKTMDEFLGTEKDWGH